MESVVLVPLEQRAALAWAQVGHGNHRGALVGHLALCIWVADSGSQE